MQTIIRADNCQKWSFRVEFNGECETEYGHGHADELEGEHDLSEGYVEAGHTQLRTSASSATLHDSFQLQAFLLLTFITKCEA